MVSFILKKLPAAIDIGTSSMKILQLAKDPKGKLKIIYIAKEAYPPHKRSMPDISQKETLKKIIERNGIGPEVVTAVRVKDVQIYNLSFPLMSDSELIEAIRWKLAQLRPFGLSNIDGIVHSFIKWDSAIGVGSTQQRRVLLACAPKDLIQNRLSLLQEIDLKAVAIEVAPLSLVNLVKFQNTISAKDEIVIWLDIGAEESALVIARDDILYFCRIITLNSQHMTRQIAQHCHMTEEEAEEAKKQYGLTFWSPDKEVSVFSESGQLSKKTKDKSSMVYHSLVSSLENLIVDIEHSFKYFSYQVTQSQITKFDRLILAGGGSNLKNLDRFLSVKLGVPVERIDPFSSFELSANIREQKGDLTAFSSEFAVCAGLAAGQRIEKTKRVDLMPREQKKGIGLFVEQLQEKPLKAAALILVLAVLIVGLQIGKAWFYSWKMRTFTGKVKAVQLALSRLQSSQLKLAKQEGQLLDRKTKLEERLSFLNESTRRPEEFSEILAQVASLLPEEIWITSILYSEKKLNITGSTSDMNLVMQLIEALKSSDKFTDATFNYTQREPSSEVYNFEVITEVKQ